ELTVESSLGKGSKFTVHIKLKEAPTHDPKEKTEQIFDKSLNLSKKILVVEDNKINQNLVVALLDKFGIKNIKTAQNGVEAVELSRENKVDIVLMGCQMPEMHGYEATRI